MVPNEEQSALKDMARRFSREKLLPGYQRRESEARMDRVLLREMGQLGLIGINLPTEVGGLDADSVTTGFIMEELGYGDFNMGCVVMVQSLCGAILTRNAAPELREQWLPRVTAGEAILGISITEPHAGSDSAAIQLKATRDGDHYVLNGEKTSATFVECAGAYIVMARTGAPDSGARGITAFFVPIDSENLQTSRFNDLGSHILTRGSLFFDNVRIPISHRLGGEGKGFSEVMRGFDYSRALLSLLCIGAAQASIDESWAYVQERQAFGGPIGRFQGVTFPLAEYDSQLAAARQLAFHALALRDAGQPHTTEASMVKWFGPKIAVDALHQCILTFGHYGWSMDLPHQQRLRDVMGMELGEGSGNIMKLVVARARVGAMANPS